MKNRKKTAIRIVAIVSVLLVIATCIGLTIYSMWKKGAFLPSYITWQEKQIESDEMENLIISLQDKRVKVYDNGTEIWESPDNLLIQDVLYVDIDKDDEKEMVLLLWRIGKYGMYKPFWVKKDEKKWSEHIFIYDCNDRHIQARWRASDIGTEAKSWDFTEKKNLVLYEPDGDVSYWTWNSWGMDYVGDHE